MTSPNKEELLENLNTLLFKAEALMRDELHEQRLEGAVNTIDAIMQFLKSEYPTVSTDSLFMIRQEITELKSGFKARIFRQQIGKKVRRLPTTKKSYEVLATAGVELLIEGQLKVYEAYAVASKILKKKTPSQLETMRMKFRTGYYDAELTALMIRNKEYALSQNEALTAGRKLLNKAKKYLK